MEQENKTCDMTLLILLIYCYYFFEYKSVKQMLHLYINYIKYNVTYKHIKSVSIIENQIYIIVVVSLE